MKRGEPVVGQIESVENFIAKIKMILKVYRRPAPDGLKIKGELLKWQK